MTRGLARRLSWAMLGGAVVTGAGALAVRERRAIATDLATERDLHGGGHAGSRACRRCHEDHYRSWHRTFHRTMTQAASPQRPGAVLGDFSGAPARSTLRYGGVVARMDRDAAGAFRMTFSSARDPARPPVIATVSRAIGSRRYQQYLTRVGDAEYRLPVAFHVEEQRWFHMNGAFLFADGNPEKVQAGSASGSASASFFAALDALGAPEYTRHVTRWNDNCVFCHNVAPNPARDPVSGAFQTEVAEMGIACEACHGPGAAHARANADPLRRYALHLGGAADPTIVNPSRLSPARSADLCGRCHGQRITDDIGRFLSHGDPFVPGDDLALWSAPLWQGTPMGQEAAPFAPRFWADGTPRLTAYEYQGLLQSPCAQRGPLTCTSCHGMHDGDPRGQLRPAAAASDGDGACTGCHGQLGSAAAKARHSRHDAAGVGARCVACHMPRIVYGVLDIHRSHRIEVPDPARAARLGRPDACTACHADESAAWAADAFRRLWPDRDADQAPSAAVAVAGSAQRASDNAGAQVGYPTTVLDGDPIQRAVAADALGRLLAPARPGARAARAGLLLEVMTGDDYPAVRHLAARALGRLLPAPGGALAAHLASHLASYDPLAVEDERRRATELIRGALPASAVAPPDPALVRRLRGAARGVAIEIGE